MSDEQSTDSDSVEAWRYRYRACITTVFSLFKACHHIMRYALLKDSFSCRLELRMLTTTFAQRSSSPWFLPWRILISNHCFCADLTCRLLWQYDPLFHPTISLFLLWNMLRKHLWSNLLHLTLTIQSLLILYPSLPAPHSLTRVAIPPLIRHAPSRIRGTYMIDFYWREKFWNPLNHR